MNQESSFPRDLGALDAVFGLAEGFADGNGLAGHHRFLVSFVLEELFTNMVKYNPGGGGRIAVELGLENAELSILLQDPDCPRFDISTDAPAVDTGLALEDRTPGGLGIHLVKNMVDRIEYDHQDRTGTIRLFKRLE